MRAFIYPCCVMLLTLPLIKSEPVGNCPAENGTYDVLLPDSADCTIFYKCNWVEAVVECANGFLFNPDLSVCDRPENVNC